jgi:hypothetical protein
MARVVVRHCAVAVRSQGQSPLSSVESLNVALFMYAQHRRLVGQVQIKAAAAARPSRRLAVFALPALAALALFAACSRPHSAARAAPAVPPMTANSGEPQVMLWAWQQPQDLRFLDPRRVGVSWLIETLWLEGSQVRVMPNLNPLRVPASIWLMACVRIETDPARPPTFSPAQLEAAVRELDGVARRPLTRGLQLDFDARQSEQRFYRRLLFRLRRRLPSNRPLSITALASWCLSDDWLHGLPANEIVPMLFNLGPDGGQIRGLLARAGGFPEPRCDTAAGLDLEAPPTPVPARERLYLFDPRGWSRADLELWRRRSKHYNGR